MLEDIIEDLANKIVGNAEKAVVEAALSGFASAIIAHIMSGAAAVKSGTASTVPPTH